jgi:hypothetical protein
LEDRRPKTGDGRPVKKKKKKKKKKENWKDGTEDSSLVH